MTPTSQRQGERILRIYSNCRIEHFERFGTLIFLKRPNMGHGPHGIVVGTQVLGSFATGPLDFGEANGRINRSDHATRYAILQIEYVFKFAVKPLGPDMVPS